MGRVLRVHFVIHEDFEAPGAYETWADSRGYKTSFSRLYDGDTLPGSIDGIDLLVVMGGPQSPRTTREECPHFDAAAECSLISRCAAAGKAVVGVCLGAQLMGEAFGGRCVASPEKEIGNFPIVTTEAGRSNRKFAHFGEGVVSGHWHGDMPGLTPRAKVLAYTQGCPRQIIEFGDLVYAFQCHMEFNPEVVELLIAAAEAELTSLTEHKYVQQAHVLRTNKYEEMNGALYKFLDELADAYRASRAPVRTSRSPVRAAWDRLRTGFGLWGRRINSARVVVSH